MRRSGMDAWEFRDLEAARVTSRRLYHEFKRVPDLSAGVYTLDAGASDPQRPHAEDELYYVVAGRGVVSVGDETRPVVPGSVIFVGAGVPHRFQNSAQRLELLVWIGSPEGGPPTPAT